MSSMVLSCPRVLVGDLEVALGLCVMAADEIEG